MLKFISNPHSIMLYWEAPENYTVGKLFEVFLDGDKIGQTENSHFEVTNLEENRKYDFSVFMDSEMLFHANAETTISKNPIDISKAPYNAIGDGKTLNTKAIQKAIEDCTEKDYVYIPKGDFMTGALRLHSNMEMYIEKEGILHGTDSVCDYEPKIKSRFEGTEMMCYASLINIGELDKDGYNCKNVRIFGEGTICGGGLSLAEKTVEIEAVLLKDHMDSLGEKLKDFETPKTIPGRRRGRLINMSSAQNVVIGGLTLMNGPSWNVHMIYCDNIVTYNCSFHSEKVWNGDGWDPDSSTNCTLFGAEFFTGDDSVAIKSGKNPEGNIINKPCEHIRVFDCVCHKGHGLAIGSEMSGGVNDIKIWNCDMQNSVCGIQIKGTKERGGYIKNIDVRNCKFSRILISSAVGYNNDGESAPAVPYFENFLFKDIFVSGFVRLKDGRLYETASIELTGFKEDGHSLKNVKLKNITIQNPEIGKKHSVVIQNCENLVMENIICR